MNGRYSVLGTVNIDGKDCEIRGGELLLLLLPDVGPIDKVEGGSEITAEIASDDPAPAHPLLDLANELEDVAKWLRVVESRYEAENLHGPITAGKAYRLMWMTARDMKNAGVLPDKRWVENLIDDMRERAEELGAGGTASGGFPNTTGGGPGDPWSQP